VSRLVTLGSLVVLLAMSATNRVSTTPQVGPLQVPGRDPSQPSMRRIPVGTGSIVGTITAADTGRPLSGVRVIANGAIAQSVQTSGAPVASSVSPPAITSLTFVGNAPVGRGSSAGVVVGGVTRMAITDVQGTFVIENLPDASYTLTASPPRNTYLSTSYGEKKPGGPGTTFTLAAGQRLKMDLRLVRGGVITGTVYGEEGDPASNAQIRAWRYTNVNGVRRLSQIGYASTDDRGVYRLFGLQPGNYLVAATPEPGGMAAGLDRMREETAQIAQAVASGAITPPPAPGMPATVTVSVPIQQQAEQRSTEGPPPAYLPVYHPNATSATAATPVRVAGGDEQQGIDIQLRLVQATNIIGTIVNPPGRDLSVQAGLVGEDSLQESLQMSRLDQTGRFTFRGIAPGKYTLVATVVVAPQFMAFNGIPTAQAAPPRQLTDAERLWGRTPIDVEGQPTITTGVTLRPGRSIAGQVVFESARPPDLSRVRITVSLSSPPGQMAPFAPALQATVGTDGRFVLTGVPAGNYILRATGMLKSSIVDGRDVLDFPLDFTGDRDITDAVVTITDKSTELSGTLLDPIGKPATDYAIVIAATEPRFWTPGSRRIVVARPAPDGRYTVRGLPAGTYIVAAVNDLDNGAQFDPEFLKSMAAASSMRVTLVEGSKVAQDLRVVR
jgi:hypothetical protein